MSTIPPHECCIIKAIPVQPPRDWERLWVELMGKAYPPTPFVTWAKKR